MIKARYGVGAVILGIFTVSPFTPSLLSQAPEFKPVTESVLTNPDPADWLMINRTFNQHRFSPLNQINKNNVGQLRMAWTRGLPAGTQETTPIVYRGIIYMYVPGASVQAVDGTNGEEIGKTVGLGKPSSVSSAYLLMKERVAKEKELHQRVRRIEESLTKSKKRT